MALIVAGISVVQPYILARSAVAVSCPADTTEDVLATIAIPAGAMGINGAIRGKLLFAVTNSANAKAVRIRFGGSAGTNYYSSNNSLTTVTGAWYADFWIANRGAANSQVGGVHPALALGIGTVAADKVTSAVDTTAATSLVISGQKVSAGDTLTLESYLVELFPTV